MKAMIRLSLRFLLALAALIPAALAAQVDGPRARFDDDLMTRLEGEWTLTRQIRGKELHNSVRASWVLNHQFLQLHMKDVQEPPAYEALVLIGFDHANKTYVAHWTDTWGGKFSARGLGTRRGQSIEFRFEYDDGPFFNTFTWQPEERRWQMRGENQDREGRRTLFMLDTLVPRK